MTELLLAAPGEPWVYAVVGLFCLIDGFFPPVPSETLVVGLASLAASQAWWGLWMLLPAAVIGAFLGDNIAYAIGRKLGIDRFRWMRRPVMQKAFAKVENQLEKRAISLLLVARFIPVGRVAVNLTAGASGYPARKFLMVSGLSATIWGIYSVAIGAVAGSWLHDHPVLGLIVAVVIAGLLGVVMDKVIGRWQERRLRKFAEEGGQAGVKVLETADAA
ncbi:membrane protein DedA with SNARE-associated domain [Arthrobacter stackebrandtii]|uniref:Membrane protein DedA with SNARE-associated domain n=1 Tax=Arthrobacter stackebrandtii TaxID=272161 RepID=A0ABS4Z1A1_9MICC|nr:DedA family protein [Arthrobacter stackebrandtii]MBP2414719.1 membrane protein DedA with SNARE-associated domain [Arthrobacter stackebrandtii]PYH01804.1 alkaline phosphatase [Arthrobacter stackebrandtii]